MQLNRSIVIRLVVLISLMASLTVLASRLQADTGSCGGATTTLPFTDVIGNPFFCQIASAYFSGLTSGTTATTYSPGDVVTREQMAAFITRTMDQSLKRGSRRAVAKKWWMPQDANSLTLTDIGNGPARVEFDGTDLWVANLDGTVMRIRPSDGKLLDTWTGATDAVGILAAKGRIFVTGQTSPGGSLYMIDPAQPAGAVTTLISNLGNSPQGIAFDGSRIWIANIGSVTIVSLNPTTVTLVTTGFDRPYGILYDGANIWVTDVYASKLFKLNSDGSIAQTISVGSFAAPRHPIFDGTNVWVPSHGPDAITVVRVKDAQGNPLTTAFVLATLTGNGLNDPIITAFDGERILVTNIGGNSVSMWKAANLTPLGSFPTGAGTGPMGACSDGLNFWITLFGTDKLARF